MSNTLRATILALAVLALPACYSNSNKTYNTPMGPAGSPGAFSLTSPANGATGVGTTPTLQWNGANGAMSYTVQVSTSPSLSSPVVNQSGITNTMFMIPAITASASPYYWQVIAHNTTGDTFSTGAVATYSSFTTN